MRVPPLVRREKFPSELADTMLPSAGETAMPMTAESDTDIVPRGWCERARRDTTRTSTSGVVPNLYSRAAVHGVHVLVRTAGVHRSHAINDGGKDGATRDKVYLMLGAPFCATGPRNGETPQWAVLHMNIGHTADGKGVIVGVTVLVTVAVVERVAVSVPAGGISRAAGDGTVKGRGDREAYFRT